MKYRIKRFARADYEGLTEQQTLELRNKRANIARDLLEKRKQNNSIFLNTGKEVLMNPQSREHEYFVNQGLLRDNRVTNNANGEIVTRNYFGRKKVHTDNDIINHMNKNQNGFIFERGTRADSHANDIANARFNARQARENILKNGSSGSIFNSPKSKTANFNWGRAGRVVAGTAGAGLAGYGIYQLLKD